MRSFADFVNPVGDKGLGVRTINDIAVTAKEEQNSKTLKKHGALQQRKCCFPPLHNWTLERSYHLDLAKEKRKVLYTKEQYRIIVLYTLHLFQQTSVLGISVE